MLVRLDWVLPRTPTSVAIALTTPFRLVVVSCTSAPKPGSLACELDIEPIVARARSRSRIYDPVVDVPVDTATEFALANNPVLHCATFAGLNDRGANGGRSAATYRRRTATCLWH